MSSVFHSIGIFFKKLKPGQIIVLVFLGIVVLGGTLLTLPAASRSGQPTSFLMGLFTATSATCVTGLVMVDSGTYWSHFGQVVILCLIQIGGLGFMTVVSIFFMVLKKKIGLRQRMVLAQAFSMNSMSGIVGMVKNVLAGALIVEGTGALLLTLCFLKRFSLKQSIWYGIFHAVSAFCNAGFDVLGDIQAGGNLSAYRTNLPVNLIIMALIVSGGLGFFVWGDIRRSRRFSKLTVYSKLVVVITGCLIVGGAFLTAVLEWNNPATLGRLQPAQKILASFFQSVTTRTAGFNTIPQDRLSDGAKAVSTILMFIGGSSGSTAGGVKTVTFGVVLLSALGTARGSSHISAYRRGITTEQIENASALVLLMFTLAIGGGIYISAVNHCALIDAVFETVSALGTVGLSANLTPTLNAASHWILIFYMFFGRVGIMTISVGFMMTSRASERIQYADTKLMIG